LKYFGRRGGVSASGWSICCLSCWTSAGAPDERDRVRAAIYARVSDRAQRDRHTIENQLRVLPAFVAAQGWELVETYVDDGRTAKTGKLEARDGFARLVRDADARRFDLVVVVDVDRLTRTDDPEERGRITGAFWRNHIQVVTPSGGTHDLRTLMGGLYVEMQARFAAEENRKRAERVKAGKLRAIAEGRKPSGPTPFGLAYSRATGNWSVEPAAGAIVREIYARVIAGESCIAIAEDLDARGAPSPGRGAWERHTVWRLVRSRHTTGTWSADRVRRLEIAVPAIVDEATWQAAQARLLEHGKRGLRRTRHVYLLEGLAVCGLCGSPIAIRSATSAPRGRTNPAAYVCRARKLRRRGERRCSAPVAQVAEVDARVWAAIATELADPELAAALERRAAAREANRRDWQADVAGYRARLARLAKVEAAVLVRYRRGTITDQALDQELAELARERAAIGVQLAAAERAAAAGPGVPQDGPAAWLAALRELGANATPAARQRVVRAIVEPGAAVFDGRRVRLTLLVEEAATSRGGAGDGEIFLAVGPGCRMYHETSMRIRLVA
jgi:site-specific DNA recombinase